MQAVTCLEMTQLEKYKIFQDIRLNAKAPEVKKKLLRFDVKYDRRQKARLVPDCHLTEVQ